jgi:trimeric autotransporter adhesin
VYTPTRLSPPGDTATLTVTDASSADPVSVSVALTGTSLSYDDLVITPAKSDLGSVPVGSTGAPVIFTLTNTGDWATGTLEFTLSSSDFVPVDDTCTGVALPSRGTCTLGIALRPTSRGAKTATLTVAYEGGAAVVRTLTGLGV